MSWLSWEFWRTYLESEFNRGIAAAFAIVLGLLLLWLILRFLIWLIFRRKSSSTIMVNTENGVIYIAAKAIETAVVDALAAYPNMKVRKVRIFGNRKDSTLDVYCSFAFGARCAEEIEAIKPLLITTLSDAFGVDNVKGIHFYIEELKGQPASTFNQGGSNATPTDSGV